MSWIVSPSDIVIDDSERQVRLASVTFEFSVAVVPKVSDSKQKMKHFEAKYIVGHLTRDRRREYIAPYWVDVTLSHA